MPAATCFTLCVSDSTNCSGASVWGGEPTDSTTHGHMRARVARCTLSTYNGFLRHVNVTYAKERGAEGIHTLVGNG